MLGWNLVALVVGLGWERHEESPSKHSPSKYTLDSGPMLLYLQGQPWKLLTVAQRQSTRSYAGD